MYAIMYLPEALWVRDVREWAHKSTLVVFDTPEIAQIYIETILIPYMGPMSGFLKEHCEILEIEDV